MRSVSRIFFQPRGLIGLSKRMGLTHMLLRDLRAHVVKCARRADRAVTRVNRHLRRSGKKLGAREVALPAGFLFYGLFLHVHLSGDDSRDRCVEGS